ncbi:MAG: hypothetical protein KA314_04175 [Chloroflexi bacterium]|nr:hypothetical protein [Chloroflexota bacterium]MBP8055009.1 hypothetical protein [Chloroflexota bacterium]
MRIDRIKEAELKKRKGITIKTIIQLLWLSISFVIAYFLTAYIFANTSFNLSFIYANFFIPPIVPQWVVQGAFIFLIVVIMQFIFAIGFALGSPEGRRRTGKPRIDSRDPDPFDEHRPY